MNRTIPLTVILFFLLTCLINFDATAQNAGDQLFTTDQIHTIEIQFEEDDFWNVLTENFNDGGFGFADVEYLMAASITIDGVVTDSVGVRQKGFSSHFASPEFRKSLKIDCNEFVSGKKVDGLKKFNLHNGVGDPGLQRELIAYDLMRNAGLAVPRVAYCRLFLNSTYWGTYTIVEQIDKSFITRNFNDDSGDLFKNMAFSELEYFGNSPAPYKDIFELKTNKAADNWADFIELMDVINNASDAEFEERIDQVFNVDQYLRALGVDIITDNWDSYIEHGRNFYLYHEPVSDQFHWLPWDYNLSFGGSFFSLGEPPVAIDPACDYNALFLMQKEGNTVKFFPPEGLPADATVSWDFGDGNTSTDLQPTHTYDQTYFEVNVCMEVTTEIAGVNCDRRSCTVILLFVEPSTCLSVINGSSPYPVTDSILQRILLSNNNNCCGLWSNNCQEIYDSIVVGVVPASPVSLINFPAFPDFNSKVLIDRLMNIEKYRTRYLDYMCDLKKNNFTLTRLSPIIDENADLIREAVYEDNNYLFSTNYFEYDIGPLVTDAGEANIPPLKTFINIRSERMEDDFNNELDYGCPNLVAGYHFQDVVINEFMAASDTISDLPDPAGEYDDWIELYNNTTDTILLNNYFLSDNIRNLRKWPLPADTKIAGDSYLIIWADQQLSQAGLHSNFKLARSGEAIYLSHLDGAIIDSVVYEEQTINLPMARIPNGTGDFIAQPATFNGNNEQSTSIAQLAPSIFHVYPNPVAEKLIIEPAIESFGQSVHLQIFNSMGQSVEEQQLQITGTVEVNTEKLAAGVYFISWQTNNGIVTKKIEKMLR